MSTAPESISLPKSHDSSELEHGLQPRMRGEGAGQGRVAPKGGLDARRGSRTIKDMNLLDRITVEPDKCGGRPCLRGLRIRVADILGILAEGVSHEQILRDFPYLEPDDIKAALAYAARQADHAVLQRS